MISKFDPNFILFEEIRSSKIVMSCYTCTNISQYEPSKEVNSECTVLQLWISPKTSGFHNFLKFELRKRYFEKFSENLLQLKNFKDFNFLKIANVRARCKATNLYLSVFLYFFCSLRNFREKSKFGQKRPTFQPLVGFQNFCCTVFSLNQCALRKWVLNFCSGVHLRKISTV